MSNNNNPNHIAFIMDGNGRWAVDKGKKRLFGHTRGAKVMEEVVDICEKKNIKYVTFYAFSTENWKRSQEEIKHIFNLISKFVFNQLKNYAVKKYKIDFIGDLSALDKKTLENIEKIKEISKDDPKITVIIALNYGARDEILRAFNCAIKENKELKSYEDLTSFLYTKTIPDPDVVVRTGGDIRLSNFLLLQSAYSELIFIDTKWPDVDENVIDDIINEYKNRNRRFGGYNG